MNKTELLLVEISGSNCLDCTIIMRGRGKRCSAVSEIIRNALKEGKGSVDVAKRRIIFGAEGLSWRFKIPKDRIRQVKNLIGYGYMQLQPIEDGNYVGFVLSRDN